MFLHWKNKPGAKRVVEGTATSFLGLGVLGFLEGVFAGGEEPGTLSLLAT